MDEESAAGLLVAFAELAGREVGAAEARAAVLRAFQVYGPGDHPTRLVPVVLEAARTGSTVALPAHVSRRDWVWVGDVVDACLRAVEGGVARATVIDGRVPHSLLLEIFTDDCEGVAGVARDRKVENKPVVARLN